MAVAILLLKSGDANVLERIADGVFDNPVVPALAQQFLEDPHHHIAVAIDDGIVVGFASGVDYIHPDKAREMFINEVGVSPSHHRRGIATKVLNLLIDHAWYLGCVHAWVLSDKSNTAARALYASAGGKVMEGDTLLIDFDQNLV